MPASAASIMASAAAKGGGTNSSEACLCPGRLDRLAHGVEDGPVQGTLVPPLPGVTPATTLVPASDHFLRAWNCGRSGRTSPERRRLVVSW
jgi:hypothetical protein